MKKSLLIGIVALGAGVATSYGQGYVALDNYASGTDTPVTYGANVPINGISGALGTPGAGLSSDWTAGLYWVGGTTGLSQAAGTDMPDASLALGTGTGSTTGVASSSTFNTPGFYSSIPSFNTGSILNTTITLEIVVYAGSSYASAQYRGHSAAFSMSTGTATQGTEPSVGHFMPGTLAVGLAGVPEPATMALGGLGLASLLLFRRKQV
jgi:hypothetical protein